jgi:DNA-binding CsgD family transcriptional regulator/tetratricopeptide (TPR) repeat protein
VLMLAGRFVAAREQAERAIALTAQVRDARSTEGHARNNLGCCLARLGDVEGGIAELRTAARIATEEFEDVDDIARAAVNLQSVLFDAGRFAEALEVARGAIAAVDGLGLYRRKGLWCRCDAIDSLLVLGRLDEVDTLLREAMALEPEGIDAVRLTGVRGLRALRAGQLEEAQRLLQEARRLGRHIVDGHLMLPMHRGLVETLRWRGDWSAAVAVADEVRRRGWGEGDAAYLVPTLAAASGAAADAAVAARTARRPEDARRWAAQAADLLGEAEAARSRAPHLLPPAATALDSARAENDRARGVGDASAWAGIAETWARLGDRLQAAVALLRAAECHLADRRRGPAGEALADAREKAVEAGAMHVVHAADALAARAGLPPARPARRAAPFGLTARESEVLALVARGHTDRQIGAALFISPRTVERHVSNILAKLDARTRAEVAAIAHREKLAGTD